MSGALNQYKMDTLNLVKTGFMDKYNVLVDTIIYDVSALHFDYGTSGETILSFYTNVGQIDVRIPEDIPSFSNIPGIAFTDLQPGDNFVYNGTNWINTSQASYVENTDYLSNNFIVDNVDYNGNISTLDQILSLLAPPKPGNLSTKVLTLSTNYTAIQTKTGTVRNMVTNNQTPQIIFNPNTATPASTNNGAYNANSGVLTGQITKKQGTNPSTFVTPSITFTPASEAGHTATDSGNNITLDITDDFDFHYGVSGKAGFWYAFLSKVQVLSALTFYPDEEQNVLMTHSITGTSGLTFWIDDPTLPTVTSIAISTGAPGTTKISGVPTLVTGDLVRTQFSVNNAIKTFYPAAISETDSTWTSSSTSADSGIKTYNQVYPADLSVNVLTGKYIENIIMTCRAYNSIGQTSSNTGTIATTQAGRTMRIDTISNESARVTSGTGLYPATTSGYGIAYDSTQLLNINSELQMLGGEYRYPDFTYTTNYPIAGPNYSTFTGWRYVTFQLNVSSIQNVTVNFLGSNLASIVNMDGITLDPTKFSLHVRVDGSIPSNGWIDGNTAYPGSGNPNNNNDPALAIAASTVTSKVVTFGSTVKTGTCYVRIGFFDTTKGAGYLKFTSVTLSAV
jgi:hypothetical protein